MTIHRVAVLGLLLGSVPTLASDLDGGVLPAIELSAPREQTGIAQAGSASSGEVSGERLRARPAGRPAERLEAVPGLVVSQHSGEGKANQYYLRGFNLDHGTDLAISLQGMPLNLPSHAHGQGYADLNLLIPELVARMRFRKGPYAADAGDFAAAGSVDIGYVRRLPAALASVSAGAEGYRRALVAASAPLAGGHLLHAVEWTRDDGPWSEPQHLDKLNLLLRYTAGNEDNGWSLNGMVYRARWTATDQVPQRALDSGLIGRYDSLDPSDGGLTARHGLALDWSARDADGWRRAHAYAVDQALDLWSNFSYCLSDIALSGACVRGDQFEQVDRRRILGAAAAVTGYPAWGGGDWDVTLGIQGRVDAIARLGLYATERRQRWATVREDAVRQSHLAAYSDAQLRWGDGWRVSLGLRADFHRFAVDSDTATNTGRVRAGLLSPKFALIRQLTAGLEAYANHGYGYHSNDARGITTRINPDFRDPASFGRALAGASPLVRSRGAELGLRGETGAWRSTLALWHLEVASELVFVGDAGTTKPGFPSRRAGLEWNAEYRRDPLRLEFDVALSHARYSRIDPAQIAGDHVPGAVERVLALGLDYAPGGAVSAGLHLRHIGRRALTEDNSLRAPAVTRLDLGLDYRHDARTRLRLDILNLLDRPGDDIAYAYASQLAGEAAPMRDIHRHPAAPRRLRLSYISTF